MSHVSHSFPVAGIGTASNGLMGLIRDTAFLIDTMLSPGRIIAEVSEMRELQVQAARIEATDPQKAAALRQRAARLGL